MIAAIIGYNYPTRLALGELGPALAAGCTVVLKAAPDTPFVTRGSTTASSSSASATKTLSRW